MGKVIYGSYSVHASTAVATSADGYAKNGITPEAGEALLIKHVAYAEQAVLRLVSVPLTDGQFDALVSFTFNLGGGALQRSTLRRKVNREEHQDVPEQFLRWVWAGGRRLRGLVRRREAEVGAYEKQYQIDVDI